MSDLRQSTASQEISLGQFLDDTDGNTEENALTIANTDIKLRKGGTITLANKNSGGATNISNGVYHATLDATDTNTLGLLEVYVHVAGALSVKSTFDVLTATAYDALYSGTFNNLAATDIVSAGAITTLSGAVVNVDLVDTTTTNTDMAGTNNALLAASYTAADNAGIASNGVAIAALNDISVSQILTTQMTESYAADGAEPTLAQSLFLTMQNLQDYTYVGTTQTVRRIDGSTTAATYTLDDATNPTAKTRAT